MHEAALLLGFRPSLLPFRVNLAFPRTSSVTCPEPSKNPEAPDLFADFITGPLTPDPEVEIYPSNSPADQSLRGSPIHRGNRQNPQWPKPLLTGPQTTDIIVDPVTATWPTQPHSTVIPEKMSSAMKVFKYWDKSVKTGRGIYSFKSSDVNAGLHEKSGKHDIIKRSTNCLTKNFGGVMFA